MSEFAKDLYESAGVIEPSEDDAVRIEPAETQILTGSTFADDTWQHAEIAGDGEWKTPKTTKKVLEDVCICNYGVFEVPTSRSTTTSSK